MEQETIAFKTITAWNIQELSTQVKEANREGWKCEGNPEMKGRLIYQNMSKKQVVEHYK